jgi:hypothetical protein
MHQTSVEHLLDLIEEVAAFDRDTAFDAGYIKGYEDGGIAMQYEALDDDDDDDDWPYMEDEW